MLAPWVPIALQRAWATVAAASTRAPHGCDSVPAMLGTVPGLRVTPVNARAGRVVLYFHGGGYVIGGPRSHGKLAAQIAHAARSEAWLVDYRLAPEQPHPAALEDALAAYRWLSQRDGIGRIVLAGDSAGAQLSSQLAALVTNPEYARELDITPALRPEQLRGVVLNCGIYDVQKMTGGSGIVGWGADQSLWAYTGSRDFEDSTAIGQMSTMRHVTDGFPPTYISGGNGDPLTDKQSKPLAAELGGLGVEVTTLFYPEDHEPALPHEYQFDLDNEDGTRALERTVEFLKAHTAP